MRERWTMARLMMPGLDPIAKRRGKSPLLVALLPFLEDASQVDEMDPVLVTVRSLLHLDQATEVEDAHLDTGVELHEFRPVEQVVVVQSAVRSPEKVELP